MLIPLSSDAAGSNHSGGYAAGGKFLYYQCLLRVADMLIPLSSERCWEQPQWRISCR
jgi:hypothetical protein